MDRPATLVEVVRRTVADPAEYPRAIAGFLDTFYTCPERRQAMIDPEPPCSGVAVTDALIGAIGEHLARRWGLVIPRWTEDPRRFLDRPYFPTPLEGLKPLLIAQSPLAFRRRLVFVEHEPLSRARMPRTG